MPASSHECVVELEGDVRGYLDVWWQGETPEVLSLVIPAKELERAGLDLASVLERLTPPDPHAPVL